jgi:GH15 family glucan-1,4-alpha-glucosidase
MGPEPAQSLSLAVVGNCEVSALIDARGRLVWMCLPRPDGDPVFSALLTPALGETTQGVFSVELAEQVHGEQHYERNTAIVATTLRDAHGGTVRIVDFCPRFRSRGRMFRPMMLVRLVEPIAGQPLIKVHLRPTSEYGARADAGRAGTHHVRFLAEGVEYRVTTDASINALGGDRPMVLSEPLVFILGPDETIEQSPAALAHSFLEATRGYWQDWVRTLAVPFDWQQEVIRAAITLKLCTFEDTGAVMAALTTSIPESPDSGRNWDYRYCWLRDSYFVVQALNRLGATRTMEGYLRYIHHIVVRSGAGSLQPLYRISGDAGAPERKVATLGGFLGMGPVRIGNQAALQTQHDVYGSVILAASQLFFDHRLTRPGDPALFAQLEALGERAAAVYELPDAGPWEFRGTERAHTFSALMSWAGCDRLARIGSRLGLDARAAHWRARAKQMGERILDQAWNPTRNCFVSSLGGEELDATVLLLPEFGLLPPGDPRFLATLDAVSRELREGDLVFRYRHQDDFGKPESAFMVCAFWYVNALAGAGRVDEAREMFGSLLQRRNSVGLLSEDIDPATGVLWGNFPQTYSMVGIINSALRLSRSWGDAL